MTVGDWIDRATAPLFPRWTLKRARARLAADMLRAYDAASGGRRTQGWRRNAGDVNAAIGQGLERTRETARDLVRNNPYAASALNTIVDHVVGWGIVAQTPKGSWWKQWAETTACDADGRLDFAGIQKQAVRTVAESGEILVRRRWRSRADVLELGLPLPLQLQLLEADYLDTAKEGKTANGGQILQGVEFDPIGRRVGYWLFPEHPGARGSVTTFGASRRIPASEILHLFKPERPGQVRGISWLAPIILRLKDFDDFEDAALMKAKIAACLAVIVTDADGTAPALGEAGEATGTGKPAIDSLYPGMIANFTQGRSATVVQPPSVNEHDAYTRTVLRAIATGLGISYEDLTGDYTATNFSSARMSRMRAWARVEDWRWRLTIPQLCAPVWGWAQQAAEVLNRPVLPMPEWTAPAMPSVDPETESNAYKRLVRIGAMSWGEMVRERGYDPDTVLGDIKTWNTKLDQAGIVLDSDPRKTTEAGNPRESAAKPGEPAATPAKPPSPSGNGSRNGHPEDRPASHARVVMLEANLADMQRRLDRALDQLAAKPPELHVTIPPGPPANVDARTTLQVESGAFRAGDVHVAAPPPAEIHVDARTTIADGAVRTEVHPPAVEVDARTTIADGAVRVDAPVSVQQAPSPPTVTVVRAPAAPKPEEPRGPIAATDAE